MFTYVIEIQVAGKRFLFKEKTF